MKRKIFAYLPVGIMIALAIFSVVLAVLDFKNGKFETTAIIRTVLICAMAVTTVLRVFGGVGESTKVMRMRYEQAYADEIRGAFSEKSRKKEKDMLIKGIDFYNKENFGKALDTFAKLLPACETDEEKAAVLMFVALAYTDVGMLEDALAAYYDILKIDDSRAVVWSNMGLIYSQLGKHEDAVGYLKNAIKRDGKNEYAYSNLANAYLHIRDYANAIENANKALEINSKMNPAISCAALAYKAIGDEENSIKFYNTYVMNGGNGEALRKMMDELSTVPSEKE